MRGIYIVRVGSRAGKMKRRGSCSISSCSLCPVQSIVCTLQQQWGSIELVFLLAAARHFPPDLRPCFVCDYGSKLTSAPYEKAQTSEEKICMQAVRRLRLRLTEASRVVVSLPAPAHMRAQACMSGAGAQSIAMSSHNEGNKVSDRCTCLSIEAVPSTNSREVSRIYHVQTKIAYEEDG